MEAKTILVLAASPLQIPAVTVSKRLGLRVVAADGNPKAPGLALADAAHVVNITDPEACLELARKEKVDGVIHICSEVSMQALGLINREMGLHGPGPEAVVYATNKERMRRAFECGNAPSPISFGAKTDEEALEAAAAIVGPVIVKPSRNSGSRGVTGLPAEPTEEQVRRAFRRALKNSRDPSVVVEQRVEGREFSVELLIWGERFEVVAVTDKVTTGDPYYVEMGHSQPTTLSRADRALVCRAAIDGVRALGVDWCAAHAEVKLQDHQPYLIEIGARLGGDFITTNLVPMSTGIDMVAAAIRLCLGEEPDLTPTHAPRAAAIRYLALPKVTVESVEGVEAARKMPGVEMVDIYVKPGDEVGEVDSSLARAGHVLAEGATAAEAIRNAERARDQIRIHGFGEAWEPLPASTDLSEEAVMSSEAALAWTIQNMNGSAERAREIRERVERG